MLVPAIIINFEAELYASINDRLLAGPMSFDTGMRKPVYSFYNVFIYTNTAINFLENLPISSKPAPENDDVPEPEDAEEIIILEEVISGESEAVVASPIENFGQKQAKINNERKQKEIIDLYYKKQISKK